MKLFTDKNHGSQRRYKRIGGIEIHHHKNTQNEKEAGKRTKQLQNTPPN